MLVRAEERGLVEGFIVGKSRTTVSHFQFVDDTIFFLEFLFQIYKT